MFCINCGNKIDKNSDTCKYCGKKAEITKENSYFGYTELDDFFPRNFSNYADLSKNPVSHELEKPEEEDNPKKTDTNTDIQKDQDLQAKDDEVKTLTKLEKDNIEDKPNKTDNTNLNDSFIKKDNEDKLYDFNEDHPETAKEISDHVERKSYFKFVIAAVIAILVVGGIVAAAVTFIPRIVSNEGKSKEETSTTSETMLQIESETQSETESETEIESESETEITEETLETEDQTATHYSVEKSTENNTSENLSRPSGNGRSGENSSSSRSSSGSSENSGSSQNASGSGSSLGSSENGGSGGNSSGNGSSSRTSGSSGRSTGSSSSGGTSSGLVESYVVGSYFDETDAMSAFRSIKANPGFHQNIAEVMNIYSNYSQSGKSYTKESIENTQNLVNGSVDYQLNKTNKKINFFYDSNGIDFDSSNKSSYIILDGKKLYFYSTPESGNYYASQGINLNDKIKESAYFQQDIKNQNAGILVYYNGSEYKMYYINNSKAYEIKYLRNKGVTRFN